MEISSADGLCKYVEVLKEFWLLLDDKLAEGQMPPAYLAVSDAFVHFIKHRRLLGAISGEDVLPSKDPEKVREKRVLAWAVINQDLFKLVHDGLLTTVEFVLKKNSRKIEDLSPSLRRIKHDELSENDAAVLAKIELVQSHHGPINNSLSEMRSLPEGQLPSIGELAMLKDRIVKYTEMTNRVLEPSIEDVVARVLTQGSTNSKLRKIVALAATTGVPKKFLIAFAFGFAAAFVSLLTPYRAYIFENWLIQSLVILVVVTAVASYLTRGSFYTRAIGVVLAHLLASTFAPALARVDLDVLSAFKVSLEFIGDTKLNGFEYAAIIAALVVGDMWSKYCDRRN